MQEIPTGLQRSHSYLYCRSSYEMSGHRQGSYVTDTEQTEQKSFLCPKDLCFWVHNCLRHYQDVSVCMRACTYKHSVAQIWLSALTLEKKIFQKCIHTMSAKSLLRFLIITDKLLYQYLLEKKKKKSKDYNIVCACRRHVQL